MATSLPPIGELTPQAPTAQPHQAEEGGAAKATQERRTADLTAQRDQPLPNKARVELDAGAGRFVHILTDGETDETLRRYPSEAQLAYSRAVMAYLRAQDES